MESSIEWSVEFDILWNNISSNQAPGLNLYEKSVFLTKAQEEIVKNHFNPKGNKYGEGFDDSAKRQTDFSNIIVVKSLNTITTSNKIDNRSLTYRVPTDVMFTLNESLVDNTTNTTYVVRPLSYTQYERLNNKPFAFPLKRQAWRLSQTTSDGTTIFEVVVKAPKTNDISYKMRYVRTPNPIILETLTNGLSINGQTAESLCELHPSLHDEILQRAVELAKMAFEVGANNAIEAGQRSE